MANMDKWKKGIDAAHDISLVVLVWSCIILLWFTLVFVGVRIFPGKQ